MSVLIPIVLGLLVTPCFSPGLQLSHGPYWHQVAASQEGRAPCGQPAAEQAAILRKAQDEKYSLRRIQFIGNAKTSDGTLRRRIMLREGDFFAREILIKSLKSVSRLKTIYPVRLRDVLAHLNEQEKTIEVVICFTEKK